MADLAQWYSSAVSKGGTGQGEGHGDLALGKDSWRLRPMERSKQVGTSGLLFSEGPTLSSTAQTRAAGAWGSSDMGSGDITSRAGGLLASEAVGGDIRGWETLGNKDADFEEMVRAVAGADLGRSGTASRRPWTHSRAQDDGARTQGKTQVDLTMGKASPSDNPVAEPRQPHHVQGLSTSIWDLKLDSRPHARVEVTMAIAQCMCASQHTLRGARGRLSVRQTVRSPGSRFQCSFFLFPGLSFLSAPPDTPSASCLLVPCIASRDVGVDMFPS